MKRQQPSYISLGGGLRLLDEDYYLEQLQGFIRSRRGFRGLCRAIGCPIIFADQGKAYVDPMTFQICMKATTRAGGRDFLMPGARGKNGKRTNYPHARSSVPPEELRSHWRWLVGELCAGKRLAKIGTPAQVKRAMLDLTTRLAELSYSTLPIAIADEYHKTITPARLPEDPDNATNQQDDKSNRFFELKKEQRKAKRQNAIEGNGGHCGSSVGTCSED
jgi:hypothetical protein